MTRCGVFWFWGFFVLSPQVTTDAALKTALTGMPRGKASSPDARPRVLIAANISIQHEWGSVVEVNGDVVLESHRTNCGGRPCVVTGRASRGFLVVKNNAAVEIRDLVVKESGEAVNDADISGEDGGTDG